MYIGTHTKLCKQLIEECENNTLNPKGYDKVRFLAFRISEVLAKHSRNETLSKYEQFICGLRYYEFFNYESDMIDPDYVKCHEMQDRALKALGVDFGDLIKTFHNITGYT